MSLGDEDSLTLTIRMRVRPESKCEEELMNLLRGYRGALNHSIKRIAENKVTSMSKARSLLHQELKETFSPPSRIAMDCYREALSTAKSWLNNPNRGAIPDGEDFEALANAESKLQG
jgi:hypothetical protein